MAITIEITEEKEEEKVISYSEAANRKTYLATPAGENYKLTRVRDKFFKTDMALFAVWLLLVVICARNIVVISVSDSMQFGHLIIAAANLIFLGIIFYIWEISPRRRTLFFLQEIKEKNND